MKSVFFAIFIFMTSIGCVQSSAENVNYKPCGIVLDDLSKTSGLPGETFVLFGKWGHSQGEKLPRINKGGPNDLEVISWTRTRITVRIPEHLKSGVYKVGVYCNDPYDPTKKGAYSTRWVDFKILDPHP